MSREFFSRIIVQSGPRWRSVALNIIESGPAWSTEHIPMDFPNLSSVAFLYRCSGGQLTDAITSGFDSTSTKPCSLTTHSANVLTNLQSRTSLLSRITAFDGSLYGLPGQQDLLWSNLSRIQVLVMRDGVNFSFSDQRIEKYTKLRVLAARRFPTFQAMEGGSHFKSLTHVYLYNPHDVVLPSQHSITLVNVTHFTIIHSTYTYLGCFVLPSVIVLELLGNHTTSQELDYIWNLDTFGKAPSPIELHLEIKANDAHLLMALKSMVRLVNLHLYYDAPQNGASKLLESLAIKPNKRVLARGPQAVQQWVPPTCSMLESLSLVYKTMSVKERVEISEKLERIHEARLGTSREMKQARVLLRSGASHNTGNLGRRYMEEGLP